MITQGQASVLHENVNTIIGLAFVASFALAIGLIIWQTAFGENPVANALASSLYHERQQQLDQLQQLQQLQN